MMKKMYYTLFTIALLMLFTPLVKAEGSCSSTTLYDEKVNASELSVNYETLSETKTDIDKDPETWEEHYLGIAINNVPDNVEIQVSSLNDTFETFKLNSNQKDENNNIYIKDYEIKQLKRMQFDIVSTSSECKGEVLKTLTLNTPMVNELSNAPACSSYPDFKYCAVFTEYDISSVTTTEFNKELESYIDSINKKNEEEEEAKNAAKSRKKYWVILIVAVVMLGGLVTYTVIKKKRSSVI